MIEVRDLVKMYGDFQAVDHLSFTLEAGEILGFLGPNGAGKSTTMNMITGYISATEGDVLVDHKSMFDEPEEAKKYIGYLPEIPPVYPDMRVEEYLNFVAELKGIARSERKAEVTRVKEKTSITHMTHKLIKHLSKGYRQRVGLAQALIGNPPVLILDEPTVGLDPGQIIEMRNLIHELSKEHSILISSHILFEVQNICNRVLIINHGKQVALDTPENIIRNLGGTATYAITCRGEKEQVKKVILSVSGVEHVSEPEENDGLLQVDIGYQTGTDIREELFFAFAKAGIPIVESKTREKSLEDIFISLTKEDDHARNL